ncbi:FAD-dependent oxidoreductase [Luteimonas sp. A478]
MSRRKDWRGLLKATIVYCSPTLWDLLLDCATGRTRRTAAGEGRRDDPTGRLSFFWSLRTDAFAQRETDGLAGWMDVLHRLWPDTRDIFAGIIDPAPLACARYRDTGMKHWRRSPVVLLGDCADAMSPQLGQGVNMTLLDAEALTAALHDATSMETALQAYQREGELTCGSR